VISIGLRPTGSARRRPGDPPRGRPDGPPCDTRIPGLPWIDGDLPKEADDMAGTVARVTEISATSDTSFDDAIKIGVERATQTLRGVKAAWVKEQEVTISDGRISGYKVNLLITFVLE